MRTSGRRVKLHRLLIRLQVHLAALLVCGSTALVGVAGQYDPVLLGGLGLAIGYAVLFRRLPFSRMLERRRIGELGCPVCSYPLLLTNWWRCTCGFVGSTPRHAFAPCRNCGREFSWIECPRCETQITL